MNKTELLTKPLQEVFPVSTAVMLVETKKYIDGIFYFEDDDYNYINEFADKLNSAYLNSLINDFDYITGDTGFILLRKYKRDDVTIDFLKRIKNG